MADAIDHVLADRQTSHGNYADTARTVQHLKGAMREGNNWAILSDIQRESLDMIQMKIGRILSGDPDHVDHWDDITGYARLVAAPLRDQTSKRPQSKGPYVPPTAVTNTPRAIDELVRRAAAVTPAGNHDTGA